MKLHFLLFSTAAIFGGMTMGQDIPFEGAEQLEEQHPHPALPNCTVGTDTDACVTRDGEAGYFVCRVRNEENDQVNASTSAPVTTSFLRHHGGNGGHGKPGRFNGNGNGGNGMGGGRPGRHGRKGHHLSSSRCVPMNPSEQDTGMEAPCEPGELFGGMFCHANDDSDRPHRRHEVQCGCCDGTCPTILDCGCTCDLISRNGTLLEDAGVWVNLHGHHNRTYTKCVRPTYADEGKATCFENCPSMEGVAGFDVDDEDFEEDDE